MQIETVQTLVYALRGCGLFTPEQLRAVVRELALLGNDLPAAMKHLVNGKRLTVYQLRKVLHGKAADLILGPYVITDKLGEGGMGRVYRALQTRIGREVALKVVRPNLLSNPIIRKRYEREVNAISALKHPNIVGIEDAGEIDGKYYLAMEFVDGVDLARLARVHQPLGIAEACEYARQAALGLQHAHESGFVHRDIKPSNIVVAGERHVPQATEPAIVKILDMGLVRAIGLEEGDGALDLTRDNTVVGTPDYMSPEQAKNSKLVDARSDLYSLGCTLYFLLAGRPPFAEGSPIEKLLKHQLDSPPPLKSLRPDVPGAVVAVVSRLMARKPADRYPSAEVAAAALAPLSHYPQGAHPVPIRVRRGQSLPAPDTLPLRPVGPAPLHVAVEATSPFSSLADPPSGPLSPLIPESLPEANPPVAKSRFLWWALPALALILAAAGLGLWLVLDSPPVRPPADPPPTTPPGEIIPPKPGTRLGIVPNVNASRLNSPLSMIPDGSALVVVAYPAAYLKEKESPFTRGAGPGKLTQWADQLAKDTALPLAQSDRVVFSMATDPSHYLFVSEGDYLTTKFSTDLEKNPKLRSLAAAKLKGPVKAFAAGDRQTAFATPTSQIPVYAVAGGPGILLKQLPRLLAQKTATPELDAGMLSALTAPTDPPPLLLAVAGPRLRLPFTERPTLKDYGIDLIVARARITDRVELEATVTGANQQVVWQFLADVKQTLRNELHTPGSAIAALLANAELTGAEADGRYTLTAKAYLTAAQWSDLLDRLFTP